MPTAATPDAVADRLHGAAVHLVRLVRKEDTTSGLSPARLSVLSVLVFGGPRTVGELAAVEQVRSPTMSGLVAQLERDGLVERGAQAGDARVVLVRPTARGRRVLQAARRRRIEALAARLRDCNPAELTVLDQAAAAIERVVNGSEPGP